MTALILQATPFVELVAHRLQAVGQRIVRALDAFAEAKMRGAVPEHEQRRSQREIKRYCQIMRDAAPRSDARHNVGRRTARPRPRW
jgi:hypothetical protein